MTWLGIFTALLSAIATALAAVAAFFSLRVSKESFTVARANAFATHHASASLKYSQIIEILHEGSRELSGFSYSLWSNWAREIESKDDYHKGGDDPRPLRHVLTNASEMLSNYGIKSRYYGARSSERAIMSPIRQGMGKQSESECRKLFEKADGEYSDFEVTFGNPDASKKISEAPAFRYAYYQLNKRVEGSDWREIWSEAWSEQGWMTKYKAHIEKVKPIFEEARESLKKEIAKLAHSPFPLRSNPELFVKYSELLVLIDDVLEDCDSYYIEQYKDWKYDFEFCLLVVCSMGMSFFLFQQLNKISTRTMNGIG